MPYIFVAGGFYTHKNFVADFLRENCNKNPPFCVFESLYGA